MCIPQISINSKMLSYQYGPTFLKYAFSTLLNQYHEELRQFWRQFINLLLRFSKEMPHWTNFPHFDLTKTRDLIITTGPWFNKSRNNYIVFFTLKKIQKALAQELKCFFILLALHYCEQNDYNNGRQEEWWAAMESDCGWQRLVTTLLLSHINDYPSIFITAAIYLRDERFFWELIFLGSTAW